MSQSARVGRRRVLPQFATGGAPSVAGGSGWINTPGLTDAGLARRVVLLSVHTPEFDYERDTGSVATFVAERSIRYPVVLDPDKVIWRRWSNRFWPAFYLYDDAGRLRRRHFGEGRYNEMEDAIRVLLGVDAGSPRAVVDE
jgi:hypothetical protein